MSRTKKIAILAIIAMVLTMLPVSLFAATADSDRLAGADRIGTAIAIADAGWSNAGTVILAPADQANLVDALAAAPLAGQEDAPILLTFKGALNADVKAKIAALGASKVYVVGAISDDVVAEVDAIDGVTAEKLSGADRWATADAINAKLVSPAGSFVVGYNALADALSVASYAAAKNFAIVLTKPDGTVDASKLVGSTTYLVGGTAVVKDYEGATRLAGADRFATNAAVAEGLNFSYDKVYVANGISLVDALAVAPLAAKANAFVALASATDVAAAGYVNDELTSSSEVIAVGGTAAVSNAVLAKVSYKVPGAFEVESVKALNASQIQVKFSKAVEKSSLVSADNELVPAIEITRTPTAASKPNRNIVDTDIPNMYASLSSDGLTLTINVSTSGKYLDGTYSFYIPAGVTSKDQGDALGAYTTQFTVSDKTAPEVVSVEYNPATDQFEVVMSELVFVDPTVTVNNGAGIGLTQATSGIKYTFDNTWARGDTVTVRVSGAVDYNENEQVGTYTKDVKITMDETALSVTSVSQAASNVIKVVFNKAISGANDEARATAVHGAVQLFRSGVNIPLDPMTADGDNKNDPVRVDTDDSSKRTYKIYLQAGDGPNYPFYDGKTSVNLTVVFGEGQLADVFGNTNKEISKNVTMTKDSTGPQIVSVRVAKTTQDDDTVIVRFNENVTVASAAGVTVRKSGVVVVGFDGVAADGPTAKEITLLHSSGTIPNGNYVVRFDKDSIDDSHGNGCAAQTVDFSVTKGDSAVTVSGISTIGVNEFKVVFSAEVNSTAIEASSYTLNGSALPAGTDLYFGGDTPTNKDTVIIKLPASSVNYSATVPLRVSKVEDKNGLRIAAFSADVDVTDNVKPTLTAATLAGNVLTLTFDENMKCTALPPTLEDLAKDFIIKGGSTELNAGDAGIADKGTLNVSVDGKKVYITVTAVGDTNWNTIKAYSNITIKTRDGSTSFFDANDQTLKKDVQLTVTKL